MEERNLRKNPTEYAADKGVGIITLNRPPENRLNEETLHEIHQAVGRAIADDEIRVVVIRSKIEEFFCAGAEKAVLQKNEQEAILNLYNRLEQTLQMISSSEKLFIAEINGDTLDIGLEIALACDLRFSTDGAYHLGFPGIRKYEKVLRAGGFCQRLPQLIGRSTAIEMLITGDKIFPAEALRIGLVNRVYQRNLLKEKTKAFAQELVVKSAIIIPNVKRAIQT